MTPRSNAPDGVPSVAARQRILVVEDEVLIRIVICDELRDAGYDVIEACDSEEALAILQRPVRIDLVLSDVRMPGSIDGLGLLAIVRAERPALPFIVMSGHLEEGLAIAAGATQFLSKPFRLNLAADAVRVALETPS